MHREDKFVMSHRQYAVDLSSLRVERDPNGTVWTGSRPRVAINAMWFRRKHGITTAHVGVLWDYQRPAPVDAAEFLERHDDGRYGGDYLARWDGKWFWAAGQDPEENARYLKLLKPVLAEFPKIPAGHDGWWRF